MNQESYRCPGVLAYHSRRAMVGDLNELINETWASRLWRRFRDWAHIKWCGLTTGHRIFLQRWHRHGNWSDGEWHVGCTHCPLFWVKKD